MDRWEAESADEQEQENNAPVAANTISIRPPSPSPARVEIPALFLPLLRTVRACTRPGDSRARFQDVDRALQNDNALVSTSFFSAEEYLKAARDACMPVDFSFDRRGEMDFVWTVLPLAWVTSKRAVDPAVLVLTMTGSTCSSTRHPS